MICLQKGQRTVTSLSAWGKQASEGEKTKVANDAKAQYDSTAPTYYICIISEDYYCMVRACAMPTMLCSRKSPISAIYYNERRAVWLK